MKKVSQLNHTKEWHTPQTKHGMGDYYGTGIRAKLGTVIEGEGMKPIVPRKLKIPPKNLA
jgi:hypothetical protein